MGFFANKVLQYQQKKLAEAENHLKSYLEKIEHLKVTGSDFSKDEKMVKIWAANIEKIKKEINKLQKK